MTLDVTASSPASAGLDRWAAKPALAALLLLLCLGGPARAQEQAFDDMYALFSLSHCEERSDEAISQTSRKLWEIAASAFGLLAKTRWFELSRRRCFGEVRAIALTLLGCEGLGGVRAAALTLLPRRPPKSRGRSNILGERSRFSGRRHG